MEYTYLSENIVKNQLQQLNNEQTLVLCEEIRHFLIQNVSQTGGHLSSNLGTIELSVALCKVFDFEENAIVWDVGHQCYTYKLLTGRMNRFNKLREKGGISGFPQPNESKYDFFISGHGNTSLSAAIGIATAKKMKGEKGKVIAIVGDGAFTGGMIYEGLNNINDKLDNLIIILNDNKMSISKNVGAMSRYLTKLRTSREYSNAKKQVEDILEKTPIIGKPIREIILDTKSVLRRAVYNSTFFEELGLQYVGLMDGNDVNALTNLFENIKYRKGPLFIHLETVKGKGFKPAEENPGAFHGVSTFDYMHITDPDNTPPDSYSNVMGKKLTELADENSNICSVTAAMKYGTGLQFFYKKHKERFFDVGMAEQHAVTFSAGLAKNGLLPVTAIYSTFLQRSYDQIIHDVVLQNANVMFAIDRAGLVPGDGETHQGIYDAAFLGQISDFVLFSPSNYSELEYWFEKLLLHFNGPRGIRYCRGGESPELKDLGCSGELFDNIFKSSNAKKAFITYGREAEEVMAACTMATENDINVDAYKLLQINPIPEKLIDVLMRYEELIFAEEGIENGGVAQRLLKLLHQQGYKGKYIIIAVKNKGIDHATVKELLKDFNLDAKSLFESLKGNAFE